MNIKCNFCGNNTVGKVHTTNGATSYVLTQVDTSKTPAEFLATSGLPVDVYGCTNCKAVFLRCDSLRNN
ncbi:hypothetical protein CIW83_18455 [Tissierella sp. P1]|uniref:hypothetical protein n=1 Tax=Tissierella sp. P1 TaxID=1280483 RepID=UPI000BA09B93|nr:hypothetical protein [Tissierella sp. P1]OZV10800.1 hypothetical protein CIW83_18455 [Tissierella sp. P1]